MDISEFTQPRRRWQRVQQKSNRFRQAKHAFLYISLPSLHDYNVKLPHFWFCRGREQTDNNFSSTLMQSFRIQLQKNLPTFDELNVME